MRTILLAALVMAASACGPGPSPNGLLADEESGDYQLDASIRDTAMLPNPNQADGSYFSMAVPFAAVNGLKGEIEDRTGTALRDRGEAHVTILTPPEVSTLKETLDGAALLAALGDDGLQSEDLEYFCVGKGEKQAGGKFHRTYFLVVTAPGLFTRRQRVADAFTASGGDPARFLPNHFLPHVTIGFTHGDLHEQDGVIKDERSCIARVKVRG